MKPFGCRIYCTSSNGHPCYNISTIFYIYSLALQYNKFNFELSISSFLYFFLSCKYSVIKIITMGSIIQTTSCSRHHLSCQISNDASYQLFLRSSVQFLMVLVYLQCSCYLEIVLFFY